MYADNCLPGGARPGHHRECLGPGTIRQPHRQGGRPAGSRTPGVTVTVTNNETQRSTVVVTDGDGRVLAQALEPGRYTVKFELAGFVAQEAPDVIRGPRRHRHRRRSAEGRRRDRDRAGRWPRRRSSTWVPPRASGTSPPRSSTSSRRAAASRPGRRAAVRQHRRARRRLPGERRVGRREQLHRGRRLGRQPDPRPPAAGRGVRVPPGGAGARPRVSRPNTAARWAASSAPSRSPAATRSAARSSTTTRRSWLRSYNGFAQAAGHRSGHAEQRRTSSRTTPRPSPATSSAGPWRSDHQGQAVLLRRRPRPRIENLKRNTRSRPAKTVPVERERGRGATSARSTYRADQPPAVICPACWTPDKATGIVVGASTGEANWSTSSKAGLDRPPRPSATRSRSGTRPSPPTTRSPTPRWSRCAAAT